MPIVKVDEINFELEDLRARVSLQAEVLDLLKLNVGADVALGRVALEIKGVEAQALLKAAVEAVREGGGTLAEALAERAPGRDWRVLLDPALHTGDAAALVDRLQAMVAAGRG